MNKNLVRTQYVILKILRTEKATNYIRGMTLAEISEKEGMHKPNTLYQHMKFLQSKGLVELGAKVERASSFFLSDSGMELLKKYDDPKEEKNDE